MDKAGVISFIRKRKIIIAPIIAIIVFLTIRAVLLQKPASDINYTVQKENLVDTVQVSGTYTTASQVQVDSPANGIISKLYVANGSTVKKGDPLFYIESTATADQQKAAFATYMAANAQAQTDNATLFSLQSSMYSAWKKYTDLATNSTYENSDGTPNTLNRTLPEFTTAQDNWYSAEALYKNQQNIIAKDEAALSSAKQSYDETQSVTVTSPAGGTVTNLLASTGDQVYASTATSPSPVLVIANLKNPYITATISEDYAARVVTGQKASIVFDSLPNQTFQGMVERVDTVGTDTNGIITYGARVEAFNLPPNIKPNMTAVITIETLRINNVLDVPNSAVILKDGINYVEEAYSHKLIPVTLGTKGTAKTVITNGLAYGTVIVANPNQ